MLAAFLKAIRQLGDPAIRRVLWLGIALSVLIFAVLWGLVGWALAHFTLFQTGWLETLVDVLGGLATLVLTWVLFPAVASTGIGLLLDDVAAAVERRHYPRLPPARPQPLAEMAGSAVRLFGILILLNLLMLPALLVPPVFPFVFYGVNGYLLGREYFELVAARRLPPAEVRRMRRQHVGRLFLAGIAIALLLTVPVVNLLAPLVATAAMVHLFEAMRQQQ